MKPWSLMLCLTVGSLFALSYGCSDDGEGGAAVEGGATSGGDAGSAAGGTAAGRGGTMAQAGSGGEPEAGTAGGGGVSGDGGGQGGRAEGGAESSAGASGALTSGGQSNAGAGGLAAGAGGQGGQGGAAAGCLPAGTLLVTDSSNMDYWIDGDLDPTLTLCRGSTYTFVISAFAHPFWIKTVPGKTSDSAYDSGVTNNGIESGSLVFVVPGDAPDTLYYACETHDAMGGTLLIVD